MISHKINVNQRKAKKWRNSMKLLFDDDTFATSVEDKNRHKQRHKEKRNAFNIIGNKLIAQFKWIGKV